MDLSAVRDLFEVRYVALSSTVLGFASVRVIGINSGLHRYQQRMVLAHEAAHLVLQHPNGLWLCRMGDWWYNKFELEAQQAAAFLLVPLSVAFDMAANGCPLSDMEDYFEVPQELILLRLRMARLVF